MNVMEFFQLSAGRWRSERTTHHLAFKRFEKGESNIQVAALSAEHPQIVALCEMHQVNPALAIGGAHVQWAGAMAWDRETEGPHEGETVFALVPDPENPRRGQLLREWGYAEIVPVIGQYEMDEEDGLVLITEYDTMSSRERFWFASADLRVRTSTVKRFGGFSTATFCTETRLDPNEVLSDPTAPSPASELGSRAPSELGGADRSMPPSASVELEQLQATLGW